MNIYNNLINKDNTNNNVLYIPSFEIKNKIGKIVIKKMSQIKHIIYIVMKIIII